MPGQFSRIVVTGNLLRFNPAYPRVGVQNSNIRWLTELLTPVLRQTLAMPVQPLLWGASSEFQARELYRRQELPMDSNGFACAVDASPTSAVVGYLRRYTDDALVIGYELPPMFEQALSQAGVPWINLILGPLRFLPDLSIGFRTPDTEWMTRIRAFALCHDQIEQHAGPVRAQLARLPSPKLFGASALFAGQVSDDVSLITGGRFATLDDVGDGLAGIFREHGKLLFKPHPYASRSQSEGQLQALRRHGTVEVSQENIYRLLFATGIRSAYALNSSITVEAPYFDARGSALIPYRYPCGQADDSGAADFVQTLDCLLSKRFWSTVFGQPNDGPELESAVGLLRQSLGMSWGMNLHGAEEVQVSRMRNIGMRLRRRFRRILKRDARA